MLTKYTVIILKESIVHLLQADDCLVNAFKF